MSIHKNIRHIRETKNISQEVMAGQLNMSVSGYAKIERGITKLQLDKLQKIAQILNIDIIELIQCDDKNVVIMANDNTTGESGIIHANYYNNNANTHFELEKLQLSLNYYKQLLAQKDNEINALKQVIELLKKSQ